MSLVEKESLAIMKLCPRFSYCSVPICPLDLQQDERDRIKSEPRCTLAKSYRLKIGQNTRLSFEALTKREWPASQRWEALGEDERADKIAILRKISPFLRGNQNK